MAFAILMFYKPKLAYSTIHGETQGTYYNITYEYSQWRDLKPRIDQQLHKFDMSLDTYDSTSLISKINRNESIRADKHIKKVFQKSLDVYHLTKGAFDITLAPIINAWGFGSGKRSKTDTASIDSLLQFVGMEKVSLQGGKVIKQNPAIQFNVNALAQGYSVDVIADFLERKGINNYLIEIGGEIKAKGVNKKGNPWRIGIDKPIDHNMDPGKNLQAIVQLKDKSLATSGNYRKFYEKDGVKYVHTINPKTGFPILSRLLSATVITNDCMTADALATSFMVMGVEKSIVFLSSVDTVDAYLIYSDENGNFKTYMTGGLTDILAEEEE
jgi:thiamine biosynthesis lipoprotein